jgi:hypothetical protein
MAESYKKLASSIMKFQVFENMWDAVTTVPECIKITKNVTKRIFC